MSGNVNVPGPVGDAGSSTPAPTGAPNLSSGSTPEPEEVAKKLKLLQELVVEQSRLVAEAHELAEKAQEERSRTEQELEKTVRLRDSVEAERRRGEHERETLELILPRAQSARVSVEECRRAAEQDRQLAEDLARQARVARQSVDSDKSHAQQAVLAIKALTSRGPLHVELVASGKRSSDVLSLLCTVISSLAAVAACLFSYWATQEAANSVHETRQATKATVLLQLLTEYSSQDMLDSMKRLRDFREAADGASTMRQRYFDLLDGKAASDDRFPLRELNNDRRRVKGFFEKLKALAEAGIIDSTLLKIRWDRSTVIYLHDVLIPMELANTDWLFNKGHIDETAKDRGHRFLRELEDFFLRTLE